MTVETVATANEQTDAALYYIRRGWSLVPLKGKTPTVKGWSTLPPTTADEAIEYASKGNFGIRTGPISGLAVLDVDSDAGGFASLAALGLDLLGVPRVLTGGGGKHYYFAYPEGGLRNSAGKLGPGLDVRADGGQVVAPPSVHPETRVRYHWEVEPGETLPPFPAAILKQLNPPRPRSSATDSGGAILQGQRNQALTSLAGSMRRRGMSTAAILAALRVENAARCSPPLPDDEVVAVAHSVGRYTPAANDEGAPSPDDEALSINDAVLPLGDLLKLEIPERRRLLPFLPEGGQLMVYGPRGIGKTYLTLTLAVSLSTPTPFLCWPVSEACGVLLVDGEMAAHDLRARLMALLSRQPEAPLHVLSHEYFYGVTQKDLNLAVADLQRSLQKYLEEHPEIRVVILDNLSCLLPGLREDKRDDWTGRVLPLLLWLRRRNIAVVLVHHAGKGGDQRGTSSREDTLDTVIKLERMPDAGPIEGARFLVRFSKCRGAYGNDVGDLEARLETDPRGALEWTWKPVELSTTDRLLRLVEEGIESGSEAAEELGISKGQVSKLKKKLQGEGKLAPGQLLRLAEGDKR